MILNPTAQTVGFFLQLIVVDNKFVSAAMILYSGLHLVSLQLIFSV